MSDAATAETQEAEVPASRHQRYQDILPIKRLAECHVSIVGVGAIGRQVAMMLSTMGVGTIDLIDFDTVEKVNLGPQGYDECDEGCSKVEATASRCQNLNGEIKINPIEDRYAAHLELGEAIFCCVDKMNIRELLWENHGQKAEFFVDGRMSAEVMRIIVARDKASREYYPKTLFSDGEAFGTSCTAKSTVYCANIAAGLMVVEFTQWLRDIPCEPDSVFNLLAKEYRVGNIER